MSAETHPSSSSGGGDSQSGTHAIDRSLYIYQIPESARINVCYYLDQNNVWEEAARKMGYNDTNDLVRIKKKSQDNRISSAEQLLSIWGDQNHSATELFMVLYSIGQFAAMDCLKDYVHKKYHRLLLNGLPNFQILLGRSTEEISRRNTQSQKILNGPEMSRDTNESSYDTESMETSKIIDRNKIEEVASAIPQILFSELVLATQNWHKDFILGRGGFGTVYKGRWKYTEVAIKKIEYNNSDEKKNARIQMKQSINELRYLNSCRHDNILPLYGYSMDGPEPCLVYQFMAGGSLERRIHSKTASPLSFSHRKRIALGTARGLQYLHTYISGKPLIHGDIKPANILLDPCCMAKIGDFGLVREGSDELMEVSSVYGTRPYLPAEFLVNRTLSTKIDTFSFGVVLFELFTALRAYDKNRGLDKAFLAKFMWILFKNGIQMTPLVDKSLDPAEVNVDMFEKLMRLALDSTNESCDKRPEMVYVLHNLENIIENDKNSLDDDYNSYDRGENVRAEPAK